MKTEFTAWSPLILGQSQAYTSHDDETAFGVHWCSLLT